ncbi:hypothetical protein BCR43DRAFT_489061 [Syncephalastrum racemosum]|uniref:Uncharacterized protein n=1 Tax=Syncephalastrum racemosum TaxID=13706 RepID=A0A1X2HJN2_SYNRA|nr:hypothetical protein BCR43DRAFT_489061 [Syncephalastrum racemosum]
MNFIRLHREKVFQTKPQRHRYVVQEHTPEPSRPNQIDLQVEPFSRRARKEELDTSAAFQAVLHFIFKQTVKTRMALNPAVIDDRKTDLGQAPNYDGRLQRPNTYTYVSPVAQDRSSSASKNTKPSSNYCLRICAFMDLSVPPMHTGAVFLEFTASGYPRLRWRTIFRYGKSSYGAFEGAYYSLRTTGKALSTEYGTTENVKHTMTAVRAVSGGLRRKSISLGDQLRERQEIRGKYGLGVS